MLNKGKQKTKLTQVMHTLKKKKNEKEKLKNHLEEPFRLTNP